jgi:two-component system, NtrC family, sensor histidine kinase HydH
MVDLTRPRQPNIVPVDVVAILKDVVELASVSGRAVSDVAIRPKFSSSYLVIAADAAQLRQLVWNLIRNAVQASAAGDEVTVQLSEVGGRIHLSVVDQGVGIDAAAQENLFDAFFTTRSHGTGVGLAVVKRIADEHGFAVRVESTQGHGATFEVDLGPTLPLDARYSGSMVSGEEQA